MTPGEEVSKDPADVPSTSGTSATYGGKLTTGMKDLIDKLMKRLGAREPGDGIYEPLSMQPSDLIMLGSSLGLSAILLIFYSSEEFWNDNFGIFNVILFIVLVVIALLGMLVLIFAPPTGARREDLFPNRRILTAAGGIMAAVAAVMVLVFRMEGGYAMFFNVVGGLALYLIMISGEGISRREAHKLLLFVVGAILLVFVPAHETFGFYSAGYGEIPLEPWNEVLIIAGAALVIAGLMSLRESTAYFAAWLYGIFILMLITLHEQADLLANNIYEPFDHSLLMIGSIIVLSGYGMSFHTYLTYQTLERHINRGHEAFEEDDLETAIMEYDRTFMLCEDLGILMDYDSLWGFKGNTLVRAGKFDDGVAHITVGLTINPDNHLLWNDLGEAYFHRGRLSPALECYRKAHDLRPADTTYIVNSGVTLARLGRYEEAIASFDRAIELEPHDDIAYMEKGRTLGRMGRYEEGDRILKEAASIDAKSRATLFRGTNFMMNEEYGKALACFDDYLSINPRSVEAWLGKGRALLKLSRAVEALNVLERSLDHLVPEKDRTLHAEIWVETSISYLMIGDYPNAYECARRATTIDPGNVDAIFSRGRAQVYLKRLDEAMEDFTTAVGRMRYSTLTADKFEKIIENYDRILSFLPGNEKAMLGKASTYRRMGRYRAALSVVEALLKKNVKNALGWNLKGAILHKLGETGDAMSALKRAAALDRTLPQAWNNMGNIYFQRGEYGRALESYNKAMELKIDNPLTVRNRLVCINNLSLKDLTSLRDVDDTDAEILIEELREPQVKQKFRHWKEEGIDLSLITRELLAQADDIRSGRTDAFMTRFRIFERMVEEMTRTRLAVLALAERLRGGEIPDSLSEEETTAILQAADDIDAMGYDPARLPKILQRLKDIEAITGRPLVETRRKEHTRQKKRI